MELHQNKDLFRDAVLAASQRFGIPEIYIEMRCLTLSEIFSGAFAFQLVFLC